MNFNYFCFEGVDGSGKTALASMFFHKLKSTFSSVAWSNKIFFTNEPGSKHLQACVDIRNIILNHQLDREALAYLFAADTWTHLNNFVVPSLEDGAIIISERCVLSDYAGPSYGSGLRRKNSELFLSLNPIIFYIDANPDICKKRMIESGKLNVFEEKYVIDNISQIQNNYNGFPLGLMNSSFTKGKLVTINNNKTIEESFSEVMKFASNVYNGC